MALGLDPVHLQAILQQVGPLLEQGFAAQQDQALQPVVDAHARAQLEAEAAQKAYAGAAAAPAPQYNGGLDQLLGNVGSVLSGNQAYGQQAHQRTENRQNDLMEQRRQNLASLQALYAQKADAAEKLGNMEMAEKARTSHERIARQLQQMDDESKYRRTVEENKRAEGVKAGEKQKDRESAERIAALRVRATQALQNPSTNVMNPETLKAMANEVMAGRIRLTDLSGQRYKGNDSERDQVVTHLAQTGQKILPPKVRDTLNSLRAAESLIDRLEEKSLGPVDPKTGKRKGGVNTEGTGLFGLRAALSGAIKQGGAIAKTDPLALSFQRTRDGFLATLARATGEKGTLNEGDIKRARHLMATLGDPRVSAEQAFKDLRAYVADMRESAIRTGTEVQPEQVPGGAPAPVQPDLSGQVDLIWNGTDFVPQED